MHSTGSAGQAAAMHSSCQWKDMSHGLACCSELASHLCHHGCCRHAILVRDEVGQAGEANGLLIAKRHHLALCLQLLRTVAQPLEAE